MKTGFAWPEQKHKLVDLRQGNEGRFGIMVAKHCGRHWMSCRASLQSIATIAGCAVYIKKDAAGEGIAGLAAVCPDSQLSRFAGLFRRCVFQGSGMKTGTGILLGAVILAALSFGVSAENMTLASAGATAPVQAGATPAPAKGADAAPTEETKAVSAEAAQLSPAGTALASADKALADKALAPVDKASADKAAGAAHAPADAVRAPADAALAPAHDAIKVLKREEVSFKEDVQPILHDYCVSCHSPGGRGHAKSGLDLRSWEGLMKGTRFGPVVIPGNSEASTFTKLLTGTNKGLKMPMGLNAEGTLDRQYILIMRKWVKQGARNN